MRPKIFVISTRPLRAGPLRGNPLLMARDAHVENLYTVHACRSGYVPSIADPPQYRNSVSWLPATNSRFSRTFLVASPPQNAGTTRVPLPSFTTFPVPRERAMGWKHCKGWTPAEVEQGS